jgi:hypothetical protein
LKISTSSGRPVAAVTISAVVMLEPRSCTLGRSQPISGPKSPRPIAAGIAGSALQAAS